MFKIYIKNIQIFVILLYCNILPINSTAQQNKIAFLPSNMKVIASYLSLFCLYCIVSILGETQNKFLVCLSSRYKQTTKITTLLILVSYVIFTIRIKTLNDNLLCIDNRFYKEFQRMNKSGKSKYSHMLYPINWKKVVYPYFIGLGVSSFVAGVDCLNDSFKNSDILISIMYGFFVAPFLIFTYAPCPFGQEWCYQTYNSLYHGKILQTLRNLCHPLYPMYIISANDIKQDRSPLNNEKKWYIPTNYQIPSNAMRHIENILFTRITPILVHFVLLQLLKQKSKSN